MSAGMEAVAHHEMAHKVVAEAGGVQTYGVQVAANGGEVNFRAPASWNAMRGTQVALLAGHAGQMRWARETGQSTPRGDSYDRAEFNRNNRDMAANGATPISYGEAKREAERLVEQNWGRIHAEAQRYYDGEAAR